MAMRRRDTVQLMGPRDRRRQPHQVRRRHICHRIHRLSTVERDTKRRTAHLGMLVLVLGERGYPMRGCCIVLRLRGTPTNDMR